MKGVVFVELLAMAEETFGEAVVDDVIEKAELENDGVYTAVGQYSCAELVKIVEAFSAHSGLSQELLQRKFGHWMFDYFRTHYPGSFEGKADSFELLEAVDQEIHVEVLKLYPEAELPKFETERIGDKQLEMTYTSPRPLVYFCHGLIEACVERSDETAEISFEAVPGNKNSTKFRIDITGTQGS